MVLGGGLIGGALATALVARGHQLTVATRGGDDRSGARGAKLDFSALPDDAALRRMLEGVDVLVNTVGIFRRTAQQSFDAIHVNAPVRLFHAARRVEVGRIVQVSALGADPASPQPYLATKGKADAMLQAIDGTDACIVRPSLVFAEAGASTRWFALLASLPLTPLPGSGRQQVQPLHLHDLVAVLVRLVEAHEVPDILDAVGPHPLSLRAYLALFKRAMGTGRCLLPVPAPLARASAALASRLWPGIPVDRDALAMLEAGSTADPNPVSRWLGHVPRAPEDFLTPALAAPMRRRALLSWTLPLMRVALAAMWIATGVVSLWLYPREDSLAMLARVGLDGSAATMALWAAALIDLVLGIALLLARDRAPVYLAQLALVLGYTAIITLRLPEQWLHPFGPVLKNLPLLAMILALLVLDRNDGPDPR